MPRAISILSALVALVFLVLVLADATLVDRRPPSVVGVRLSTTAGDDRIAEPISSINVVFSEPVRTSSAESRFHLEPGVAGALTWAGPTLIFTPSEPLPAATDFVVRVEPGFVDLAGNVGVVGVDEWAFATAGPPRVLVVNPPDGSVGLATDASIELEFDRLMDTASVESAIRLEPVVAFKAAWAGTRVTLTFDPGLRFGTAYTLEIGSAASDTAGAQLVAPFELRFSTVTAGLDTEVVPAPGVAGIAVRSPIAVLFDGPIEPASADGALTITPAIGGDLQVVAPPSGGPPSVLLLRPFDRLAENTTYSVTLAPVVHRLGDPAQVAAGRTWSFTTGSETESAQNQIAFLSERSGVRNLWIVNPDGTNARQLTWELAPVTAFDFSGDGTRLVYASGGVVSAVNVDGSDARAVTNPGFTEASPRLSPDEARILLARSAADGTDLGWWLVPAPWSFGDERQVVAEGPLGFLPPFGGLDLQPAFDASGRFMLLPTGSDLALIVVDLGVPSGELPPVTPTGVSAFGSPEWSESESRFTVTGLGPGQSTPYVQIIGLDGAVGSIGPDKAVGNVSVDAAGRIIFIESRFARGRLVLAEPGGTARWLTDDETYDDTGATFAPDGRHVVFARVLQGSGIPAGLWLIDADGGSPTQLTVDGSDPRWLP